MFDFDDLIYKTVELFEENPDVLEYYQNRFKYIMVDEYQDTSHSQFRLIHNLAKKYSNICVVGDDDQSIYRFRGADIANILDFEKQFTIFTEAKDQDGRAEEDKMKNMTDKEREKYLANKNKHQESY